MTAFCRLLRVRFQKQSLSFAAEKKPVVRRPPDVLQSLSLCRMAGTPDGANGSLFRLFSTKGPCSKGNLFMDGVSASILLWASLSVDTEGQEGTECHSRGWRWTVPLPDLNGVHKRFWRSQLKENRAWCQSPPRTKTPKAGVCLRPKVTETQHKQAER